MHRYKSGATNFSFNSKKENLNKYLIETENLISDSDISQLLELKTYNNNNPKTIIKSNYEIFNISTNIFNKCDTNHEFGGNNNSYKDIINKNSSRNCSLSDIKNNCPFDSLFDKPVNRKNIDISESVVSLKYNQQYDAEHMQNLLDKNIHEKTQTSNENNEGDESFSKLMETLFTSNSSLLQDHAQFTPESYNEQHSFNNLEKHNVHRKSLCDVETVTSRNFIDNLSIHEKNNSVSYFTQDTENKYENEYLNRDIKNHKSNADDDNEDFSLLMDRLFSLKSSITQNELPYYSDIDNNKLNNFSNLQNHNVQQKLYFDFEKMSSINSTNNSNVISSCYNQSSLCAPNLQRNVREENAAGHHTQNNDNKCINDDLDQLYIPNIKNIKHSAIQITESRDDFSKLMDEWFTPVNNDEKSEKLPCRKRKISSNNKNSKKKLHHSQNDDKLRQQLFKNIEIGININTRNTSNKTSNLYHQKNLTSSFNTNFTEFQTDYQFTDGVLVNATDITANSKNPVGRVSEVTKRKAKIIKYFNQKELNAQDENIENFGVKNIKFTNKELPKFKSVLLKNKMNIKDVKRKTKLLQESEDKLSNQNDYPNDTDVWLRMVFENDVVKNKEDNLRISESANDKSLSIHFNETGCISKTNNTYFEKKEDQRISETNNIQLEKKGDQYRFKGMGNEKWLETILTEVPGDNKKFSLEYISVKDSESALNIDPQPFIKRYRNKTNKLKLYKIRNTKDLSKRKDDFDSFFKKVNQEYEEEYTDPHVSVTSWKSHSSSFITDDAKSADLSSGSDQLTDSEQKLRLGLNSVLKDKSLLSPEEYKNVSLNRVELLKKIRKILKKVFNIFKEEKSPVFQFRRQIYENCYSGKSILNLKPAEQSKLTLIRYNSSRSRSKFCLMTFVLWKIVNLLETDTKLTKREIYYQIKHLIKNQKPVNSAIHDVSCLLNAGPWDLNIVTSCGLVFGNLKLILSSGKIINCNAPGTLIPHDINDIVQIESSAQFILVVEKESIFQKLLEENLPNKLTHPFIMITGKGFPDLNARLFTNKIWKIMKIPTFILVDADPHGIQIMFTYRFGALSNSHLSQQLAIPSAKWIGVFPSEILKLDITSLEMTEREIKLAKRLTANPCLQNHPKIVEEIAVLIEKNRKASIEGLIKADTFLSKTYLPAKFCSKDLI